MTINSPAPMIFAMYLVVAEQQGADWQTLSGTIQNDILKEFIAQKEYIFPPRPSMRLITDIFEFCAKQVPKWNTISVSGYHIREAGSTALQELAFTLRDGIEYVAVGRRRRARRRRLRAADVVLLQRAQRLLRGDRQVPRRAQDLGDGACAIGSARRTSGRWKLRFHTQTAGVSLTAQQPYNNVVRTALQALSAVLGGTNSLHTNSLDEALALPTAEAATLALRTQQVIAHESGVTNMVDPLGGSYFVERLTLDMEEGADRYFDTIDRMGGMVAAIEQGYPQREIAEASYRFQQAVEAERTSHRRRQRLRRRERGADADRSTSTKAPPRCSWRASIAVQGQPRRRRARRGARRAARRAPRAGEHDVSAPRMRAGLRHGRRDVRRAARGLGRIRGSPSI